MTKATTISTEEVKESIHICNDIGPSKLVESIDTGIPQIGTINKNEITTFVGTSCCGKTIILDDIAYNVAKSGKKVLYVDFCRNTFMLTENLIVLKLSYGICDVEFINEIRHVLKVDLIIVDTPNILPTTMKKLQKLAIKKKAAIVLAVQCKKESFRSDNSVAVHPMNISYCSARIYTLKNNAYNNSIEIHNTKHRDGIKGRLQSYFWQSSARNISMTNY